MIGAKYAVFSVKHPWLHRLNLLIVLSISLVSGYQLLVNEQLIYSVGALITLLSIIVFASASDFKRKYVHIE